MPRRITAFSYLKQLELFVLASPDYNLLSLTSLINAAPLLQKFNLSVSYEILPMRILKICFSSGDVEMDVNHAYFVLIFYHTFMEATPYLQQTRALVFLCCLWCLIYFSSCVLFLKVAVD